MENFFNKLCQKLHSLRSSEMYIGIDGREWGHGRTTCCLSILNLKIFPGKTCQCVYNETNRNFVALKGNV